MTAEHAASLAMVMEWAQNNYMCGAAPEPLRQLLNDLEEAFADVALARGTLKVTFTHEAESTTTT